LNAFTYLAAAWNTFPSIWQDSRLPNRTIWNHLFSPFTATIRQNILQQKIGQIKFKCVTIMRSSIYESSYLGAHVMWSVWIRWAHCLFICWIFILNTSSNITCLQNCGNIFLTMTWHKLKYFKLPCSKQEHLVLFGILEGKLVLDTSYFCIQLEYCQAVKV